MVQETAQEEVVEWGVQLQTDGAPAEGLQQFAQVVDHQLGRRNEMMVTTDLLKNV